MPAPITPEDLGRFEFVDHARLSPDGGRVAYQVWSPDLDARANQGRILIRDLSGEAEAIEVTGGPHDFAPEWSPDGRRLLFLRRLEGQVRLLTVAAEAGAQPVVLAELPDGVGRAIWSPDGTQVAFLGRVLAAPDAIVDDARPVESGPGRRPPVARIISRLNQVADGRGHIDGRFDHLHVVAAAGGEPRRLTDGHGESMP